MSWLGDLISNAVDQATSTADATVEAIDAAVHVSAVRMLHAVLPPMVRAGYGLVKAGNTVAMGAAVGAVGYTLGSADASAVMSGTVEKKVTEGLMRLTTDTDYARAVRSMTS